MKRLHLFEFEDQAWLPPRLRNYVTDFLRTVSEKCGMFDPIIPHLVNLIEKNDLPLIVDLASGSGGQWRSLFPKVIDHNNRVHLTLTDKFPNEATLKDIEERYSEVVKFDRRSIDATRVPTDLRGIRTIFLSLHHFREEEVQRIFEDAVKLSAPIAIFEAQRRDIEHVVRCSSSS